MEEAPYQHVLEEHRTGWRPVIAMILLLLIGIILAHIFHAIYLATRVPQSTINEYCANHPNVIQDYCN